MIFPEADKLENWGNKYALVALAAKRAKQLKSGAPVLIETESRNPLTIALEEIAAGKIITEVPDVDVIPTVREEPEVAQLLALSLATDLDEQEESETVVTSLDDSDILEDELEDELESEEEEEEIEEEPLILHDYDEETEEAEDEILDEENELEIEEPVVDDMILSEITEPESQPKRRGRKPKVSAEEEDEIENLDIDVDISLIPADDIEEAEDDWNEGEE